MYVFECCYTGFDIDTHGNYTFGEPHPYTTMNRTSESKHITPLLYKGEPLHCKGWVFYIFQRYVGFYKITSIHGRVRVWLLLWHVDVVFCILL
jgi:hypothetical protein